MRILYAFASIKDWEFVIIRHNNNNKIQILTLISK